MEPIPYVPQRPGSRGDCVVASLATITDRPYDDIADALGFDEGRPGLSFFEAVFPLANAGFAAAILFTAEAGARFAQTAHNRLASRASISALLTGRSAVLLLSLQEGEHAVAWHQGQLIDGRFGIVGDTLDGIPFDAALLIAPLIAAEAAERSEPTLLLREAA